MKEEGWWWGADTATIKRYTTEIYAYDNHTEFMPDRTSPGTTRSASPTGTPGLGRKVGYRRRSRRKNWNRRREAQSSGEHLDRWNMERSDTSKSREIRTTTEGDDSL
jgi:hypothetical protein